MAHVESRANDNIVGFGLGDWYDNHSEGAPALTPVALTDTAFYYNNYATLTRVAQIMGKKDAAVPLGEKAEQIRTAFNPNSSTPRP